MLNQTHLKIEEDDLTSSQFIVIKKSAKFRDAFLCALERKFMQQRTIGESNGFGQDVINWQDGVFNQSVH